MQSPEMRKRYLLEALLTAGGSATMGLLFFVIISVGLRITGTSALGMSRPPGLVPTFIVFVFGFGGAGLFVGLVTPAGARKWFRRAIAFVALIPVMVCIPLLFDEGADSKMPAGGVALFAFLECLFCSFPFGDVVVLSAVAMAGKRQKEAQKALGAVSAPTPSSHAPGDGGQAGGGGARP